MRATSIPTACSKEETEPRAGTDEIASPATISPEQVVHEFAPRIYSLALRFLGNESDAEDVTQDVLVQVVRCLGNFRGDSQLSTWLHRVTVNAALAVRRRQARRPEQQVDNFFDGVPDPSRPEEASPDGRTLTLELREHLERAIAQLPDIYRDVFILSDVEGLPGGEVASLLELSLPAVKSRLHRARLAVRDTLRPYIEDDGRA
jgi:RNA polymerase sigma-70 factor, ECF subfamily